MKLRLSVIAHGWNHEHHCPVDQELIGTADDATTAHHMCVAHAEQHGKRVDYQNYSVALLPYPDPEALARSKVADWVRWGRTYGEVVKGQGGSFSTAWSYQIGGHLYMPGAASGTKLAAHEIACRVGDEWQVFDLRTLWAEEVAGVRQGALL